MLILEVCSPKETFHSTLISTLQQKRRKTSHPVSSSAFETCIIQSSYVQLLCCYSPTEEELGSTQSSENLYKQKQKNEE